MTGRPRRFTAAMPPLAIALLVLTIAPPGGAQEPPPKPKAEEPKPALSAAEREKNVESFEVVWTTIRDKHFDPKLGGLDWQAVHDELRPKVEQAASKAEARAVMSEALDRLKQTHFGIIPSDAYRKVDEAQVGGPGEAGVEIRIVDGKAVVSAVLDGSTAQAAGVKPGWLVEKVRDKPAAEILADVEKAYGEVGLVRARKALSVQARISGPIGGTVPVTFRDGDDQPVTLDLKLAAPTGNEARFGNLPPFRVRFISKRVADTVGYVGLNVFFDPAKVISQFAEAVAAHRDTEGLIIDLRGNPGGVGAMALGIGGWLVSDSSKKLGTMTSRDGSFIFALNPRAEPFGGPVAILVDELSMSTAEILAGGLQDIGRARVFGTKTPGAALPSRVDVLPNGDRFQYAFANYISAGGKPLEGVGVTPDESVPLDRAALLAGKDAAVDAAVAWIRAQKKTP